MIWRLLLKVLILWPMGLIILLPATLYAEARKLNRLPWGLNPIYGCEEDGWNGNGVDPRNPRQGWRTGDWGRWHEELRGAEMYPSGTQGWWPDYKKMDWNKSSFIKRWWMGYQWCALRNVCWNLRLRDWYGIGIHKDDISIIYSDEKNSSWTDKKGNVYYSKTKVFKRFTITYGWEFYPYIFDKRNPRSERIIKHGYTKEYKYKTRSAPSIRIYFL